MREIKFRAYSRRYEKYMDPNHFFVGADGAVFYETIANRKNLKLRNWIPEQYTGLKDKNGKKIFEGDIVLFKDMYHLEGTKEYRLEVYFNEYGEWCAGNMLLSRLFTEKTLEIIGNIHQNADLLEAEK